MMDTMSITPAMAERQRQRGMAELRRELEAFSVEGLAELEAGLEIQEWRPECKVLRGSWTACPLSFALGFAGSARRDSCGRARNDFTLAWDNGFIEWTEVLAAVEAELARRTPAAEWADAIDELAQAPDMVCV